MRIAVVTLAGFALCLAAAAPAQAKPKAKYFMVFRETLETGGLKTGLKDRVKPLMLEELRKYPEFVLDLPDAPTDAEALAKYLKKKGLTGYEINLRLTKLTTSVRPPAPGEKHKTLSVTVAATVFGTSFPQKSFAVGGEGESTVEIPIRVENPRDLEAAKGDALKDAIQQAVAKTLRTLDKGFLTPTPEKRKKK
jgi:hypothetical protein